MVEYGELTFTTQKNGNLKGILCYYDENGDRHQRTKTSKKKSRREAKSELRLWEAQVRAEAENKLTIGSKNDKKTIEEAITDYLNKQLSTGKIERSTYVVQMRNYKKNVFPYIGDVFFKDTTKELLETWLTKLYQSNLKNSSIYNSYASVAKVYKYWQKQGEISRNPFDYIDKPSKIEPRATFLDPDQIERLVMCLNDYASETEPLYVAVELALLAGLRRGEICGLRWYDIDFDRNLLTVSSAIGVANGPYTKGPKNRSSNRTFPMIEQLAEVLKARRDFVEEEYGYVDSGWFVCGKKDRYLTPSYLAKQFRVFVNHYELVDHYKQKVKLHSLRHNFATVGVKANVDIASLSKMMGHASKAMTLDTYADASPQAMKLATKQLEQSFGHETEILDIVEE